MFIKKLESLEILFDCPDISLYLYFSRASDELDNNSLTNTSLSVYMLLATMSNNFFVSAWKCIFSDLPEAVGLYSLY